MLFLSCEDQTANTGIIDLTIDLSAISSGSVGYSSFTLELNGEEIHHDILLDSTKIYNSKIEGIELGTYTCRLEIWGDSDNLKYASEHDVTVLSSGLNPCEFKDFTAIDQTVKLKVLDRVIYGKPIPILLELSHPELPVTLSLMKGSTVIQTFDLHPDSIKEFYPDNPGEYAYYPLAVPNYSLKIQLTDLMVEAGTDLDYIGVFRFKISSSVNTSVYSFSNFFKISPFYLNTGQDDSEDWAKLASSMTENIDTYFDFNDTTINCITKDLSEFGRFAGAIGRRVIINNSWTAKDAFNLVVAVDILFENCGGPVDNNNFDGPGDAIGSLAIWTGNTTGYYEIGIAIDSTGITHPFFNGPENYGGGHMTFLNAPVNEMSPNRLTVISPDRRSFEIYFNDILIYKKEGVINQYIYLFGIVYRNRGCPVAFDNFAVYGFIEGLDINYPYGE